MESKAINSSVKRLLHRACMCCLDTRDLFLGLPSVTAITFMDFCWPARLSLYAKECSKFNLHAARVSFFCIFEEMLSLLSNLNRLIFCKFLLGYVLLQSLLGGNLYKQRVLVQTQMSVLIKLGGKRNLRSYDINSLKLLDINFLGLFFSTYKFNFCIKNFVKGHTFSTHSITTFMQHLAVLHVYFPQKHVSYMNRSNVTSFQDLYIYLDTDLE